MNRGRCVMMPGDARTDPAPHRPARSRRSVPAVRDALADRRAMRCCRRSRERARRRSCRFGSWGSRGWRVARSWCWSLAGWPPGRRPAEWPSLLGEATGRDGRMGHARRPEGGARHEGRGGHRGRADGSTRAPTRRLRDTGLVIFDEFHERSLIGRHRDSRLRVLGPGRPRAVGREAPRDVCHARQRRGGGASSGVTADPAPIVTTAGTHPSRRDPSGGPARPAPRSMPAVWSAPSTRDCRGPDSLLVFLPGVGEIRSTAERELSANALGPDGPADPSAPRLAPRRRTGRCARGLAATRRIVLGHRPGRDQPHGRRHRRGDRHGSGPSTSPRHPHRHDELCRPCRSPARRRSSGQGRAGRTGPGIAIRLWSKVEHGTRPPFLPSGDRVGGALRASCSISPGGGSPTPPPFPSSTLLPRHRVGRRGRAAPDGSVRWTPNRAVTELGAAMARAPRSSLGSPGCWSESVDRWLACRARWPSSRIATCPARPSTETCPPIWPNASRSWSTPSAIITSRPTGGRCARCETGPTDLARRLGVSPAPTDSDRDRRDAGARAFRIASHEPAHRHPGPLRPRRRAPGQAQTGQRRSRRCPGSRCRRPRVAGRKDPTINRAARNSKPRSTISSTARPTSSCDLRRRSSESGASTPTDGGRHDGLRDPQRPPAARGTVPTSR